MDIQKITSPTLLLNKALVIKNIENMAAKAKAHNLTFRPHFKTHQAAEIGSWFKKAGVEKITVSSVAMAEYFAANNWNDITIAFPLNIRELQLVESLAKRVKINVLISSMVSMEYMVQNCKQKLGFFIKIDTGYHRTGILAENIEAVQQLVQKSDANDNLHFKGLLAHFGHSYYADNKNDVLNIFETGKQKLFKLKTYFIKQHPNMLISIGDTPSCTLANDFLGVDEIRPGNFVFFDVMQSSIGTCAESDIAVAVVCPVVDKYPERGELVIYGGAVQLSKEYIIDKNTKKIYGKIAKLTNKGWAATEADAYMSSLSQEHGIIKANKNFIDSLEVGDLLAILPVHSCLTANLLKRYLTIDGDIIKMWNNC